MRRAVVLVLALAVGAPLGCSLLVDDSGLSRGDAPVDAGAPEEAAAPEVATPDLDAGAEAAAVDAGDPYVLSILADAPLGYWRLEEESGDLLRDEIAARPLTLIHPEHATLAQKGVRGRAISLDGNTELRLGGPPLDLAPARKFTIECWARPTDTADNYRRIFTKLTTGGGGPRDGTYLWVNADRAAVGFERWRDGSITDSAYWPNRPPATVFTHLVVVFDGVVTRLYANSAVVGTGDGVPGPAADPAVGAAWGFNFAGDLDELAFYDKPLSSERVKAHYDAAK